MMPLSTRSLATVGLPLLCALACTPTTAPTGLPGPHAAPPDTAADTDDTARDTGDTARDTSDTARDTSDTGHAPPYPGNVLVITADDVGVDKIGVYGERPDTPATPNIDALAARGVLFRNAWSNPMCSASRASLLTGRHATRTGIGRAIDLQFGPADLPRAEVTIPEMLTLAPADYSSAVLGKWHLVMLETEDATSDALHQGFDHHYGTVANLAQVVTSSEVPPSYTHWEKVSDGEVEWRDVYVTIETTEDALAAVRTLPQPWFLVVNYHAPHDPLHEPPIDLYTTALPERPTSADLYGAMLEALDFELGRLLDGLGEDLADQTTVVFLGDNGTPRPAILEPLDPARSKETVFEGGVNVPLIVAGPVVVDPGRECEALVHLVDLMPTVADIAGVDLDDLVVQEGPDAGTPVTLDGLSLLPYLLDREQEPQREYVFTEGFQPNGEGPYESRDRAIRDAEWKLIRTETTDGTSLSFFHFDEGAIDEGPDLLEGELSDTQRAAYDRLLVELSSYDAMTHGFGE